MGCLWSWGSHRHGFKRYIGFTNATDAADAWLCGPSEFEGPCTPEHPCLWDVVSDPSERQEVAATNPKVVASLMARLTNLAKDFAPMNSTTVFPTGGSDFCKAAVARTHGGRQFCGPWYEMPDLLVQSTLVQSESTQCRGLGSSLPAQATNPDQCHWYSPCFGATGTARAVQRRDGLPSAGAPFSGGWLSRCWL